MNIKNELFHKILILKNDFLEKIWTFWNSMKSIFLVLSNYLKRQNDEFYLLILQHHSQVISKLQSVKIKSQGSVQPIKVQNDSKVDISCSSDLL